MTDEKPTAANFQPVLTLVALLVAVAAALVGTLALLRQGDLAARMDRIEHMLTAREQANVLSGPAAEQFRQFLKTVPKSEGAPPEQAPPANAQSGDD